MFVDILPLSGFGHPARMDKYTRLIYTFCNDSMEYHSSSILAVFSCSEGVWHWAWAWQQLRCTLRDFTDRFLNCADKCLCAMSLRATTISPLVPISSRCTIPGRKDSLVFASRSYVCEGFIRVEPGMLRGCTGLSEYSSYLPSDPAAEFGKQKVQKYKIIWMCGRFFNIPVFGHTTEPMDALETILNNHHVFVQTLTSKIF